MRLDIEKPPENNRKIPIVRLSMISKGKGGLQMDEILCRLLEDALHHPELKQKLLQTEQADDPMDAFCQLATQFICYGTRLSR